MRILFLLITLFTGIAWGQPAITLDKIWTQGTFYPSRMYNLKTLQHAPQYTVLEYNPADGAQEINLYDFATLTKVKTIFRAADHKQFVRLNSYTFTPNEQQLLIAVNSEYIYRHSFIADYYLYDLATGKLRKITNDKIQSPLVSPDGKKIAFARNNDLYVYDLATDKEKRITTDGAKNKIINGIADWVYEEEFSTVRFFDWNADGTQLAFVRFDEQQVPEFSMDIYGTGLYPTQQTFKYPKAGEPNSVVSLHIYDLAKAKTTPITLEAYYIPRLQWSNNPKYLTVQTLNRHQNDWQLLQVDAQTFQTRPLVIEKSKTYIEINDKITFLADNSFIYQSERDGYNHLYHCDAQGKSVRQLTFGQAEVTDLYGYDTKNKQLFYQATQADGIQRAICAVGLNGKNQRTLSAVAGTHKATFSGDFAYYIDAFSSATTPPRYTLHAANGKELKEILNNNAFAERLKGYQLPTKEYFQVKTSRATLNAYIMKPFDFNPEKKYPVLMYQYSGPGSQEVADEWWDMNDFWHAMLTQKGYIVLCVDGRGTGYRGEEFKKCTYEQLGKFEVDDQAEVATIVGNYPYVDKSRIGIWGWSFGGFMSSNCIFQKGDVFKMAIAVAPVTNWRFYDTVYTERFMRTPQENPAGYDLNSPLTHAHKLKGKYLLVHGTADDNVHVQNAMSLIEQLVTQRKDFDWLIYPDRNHGIYDNTGSTRWQLYHKMTQFIEENL